MARGRPALATVLMATGIIALAVPGSSAFAGEFLILAGVFSSGWGWAVAGATGIVLAAMYMLRLISAVLHKEPGPAVSEAALDLRPAELGIVVPLVGLPARALGLARSNQRQHHRALGPDPVLTTVWHRMIDTPSVDWFALSPSLVALGAAAICLLSAVLTPRWLLRPFAAFICALGFVGGIVMASLVYWKTPDAHLIVADAVSRDRFAAVAQLIVMASGLLTVGVSYSARMREDHIGEYYALLATAVGGMAFLVQAGNLMTLFLGLEWFSVCLYILCAIEIDLVGSLEAGLKYLIIGGMGSAVLLFGSALVYGSTGELGFSEIANATSANDLAADPILLVGLAMIIAGLAFKASAAPFHMWTPDVYEGAPTPGDRVHGRCDEDGRARARAPRAQRGVSGEGGRLDDRRRLPRLRVARLGQPRGARPDAG